MATRITKQRTLSMPSSLRLSLLRVTFLVAIINRNHDFFVVLPAVAPLSEAAVVEAFGVVPAPNRPFSFFQNNRCSPTLSRSKLFSTSASAVYLQSISYQPPTLEDGLLGATSKYLDAISSVSTQLQSNNNINEINNNVCYASTEAASASTMDNAHAFAKAAAAATSATPPPTYANVGSSPPFSEDQLVNEVVQRVTQDFSSALEAFGGETYDSLFDGLSGRPQYLWEMDDFDFETTTKPAVEVAKTVAEAASNSQQQQQQQQQHTAVNPEETMRELSNKLEGSFRNFKESLSSSTHFVTSTFTDSLRRETARPNAAVITAKQQENIAQMRKLLDEGQLSPGILSQNAKDAVNLAVNSLGGTISETASGGVKSLSKTASSANSALSETQQGIQKSIGTFVTNTNQGIGKALSSLAESTNTATHSITESANVASSAVTSAIGGATSSASSAVTSAIGGATSGTAKALAVTASSVKESVGAAGAAVKTAVVTAKPGTAATSGKVSAVALSANQGFGMPDNAYGGGGDVAGLVETVVATVASLPQAVTDAAMTETNNPNAMGDLMEGISTGLYKDILEPLSEPLRESAAVAATATNAPLEQARAVLETLQMVMALVVSIPRAAVEGVTGQPISEVQAQVAQADINALYEQLSGFASTVATLLISFLKVVAQVISYLVAAATSEGGTTVAVSTSKQQEMVDSLVSVLLEDLLPAIIDGLAMVLQQYGLLLLDGSSTIVAAL